MKLVFLGTTGSMPTSQRGLPAIAVKRERELLLFDCGEGTQMQMVRAGLSPMKVDAVFITHLHGDHFLGLAGLVQTMSLMDRTKPLDVYCPVGERERLEAYLRIPHYTSTFDVRVVELEPGDELRREGYRILTASTDHPVPELAYALVEDDRPGRLDVGKATGLGVKPGPDFSRLKRGESIGLPGGGAVRPEDVLGSRLPGRKVAYTGDTRPSDGLVELARGADVLIHDCTLGEELREKAHENYHSTPRGAAETAKRSGAKLLVLVHLSPRYVDDSEILAQAREVFPDTVVAKDLMELEIPLCR